MPLYRPYLLAYTLNENHLCITMPLFEAFAFGQHFVFQWISPHLNGTPPHMILR